RGGCGDARTRAVRHPSPLFPPIEAAGLQGAEDRLGDRPAPPAVVLQLDHRHAPRLAVATGGEHRPLPTGTRLPQGVAALPRLGRRSAAEKRERDVEVLARDETQVVPGRGELAGLTRDDGVHRGRRQEQGAEEPKPLIALHASDRFRAVPWSFVTTRAATCAGPAQSPWRGRSPGRPEA